MHVKLILIGGKQGRLPKSKIGLSWSGSDGCSQWEPSQLRAWPGEDGLQKTAFVGPAAESHELRFATADAFPAKATQCRAGQQSCTPAGQAMQLQFEDKKEKNEKQRS